MSLVQLFDQLQDKLKIFLHARHQLNKGIDHIKSDRNHEGNTCNFFQFLWITVLSVVYGSSHLKHSSNGHLCFQIGSHALHFSYFYNEAAGKIYLDRFSCRVNLPLLVFFR